MANEVEAKELARQWIETHEGFSQFPKPDAGDTIRVGYGLNLTRRGLKRAEADWLVIQEVRDLWETLNRCPFFARLNEARQAALLDMAYNLGAFGFSQFHRMIDALDRGDFASAADEMLRSDWTNQVKIRAVELAYVVRTGETL